MNHFANTREDFRNNPTWNNQPGNTNSNGETEFLKNGSAGNTRHTPNPHPQNCRNCPFAAPLSNAVPFHEGVFWAGISYLTTTLFLGTAFYLIASFLARKAPFPECVVAGAVIVGWIGISFLWNTVKIGTSGYVSRCKDGRWSIHLGFFAWRAYNKQKNRREFLNQELSQIVQALLETPFVQEVSVKTWLVENPNNFLPKPSNKPKPLPKQSVIFSAIFAAASGIIANLVLFKRPNIRPLRSAWYELYWVKQQERKIESNHIEERDTKKKCKNNSSNKCAT